MAGEDTISQPGGSGTDGEGGERQSINRRALGFEPTDDESTVVKGWLGRVTRAEDATCAKEWRDSLETLRRYERGKQTVDDTRCRTNMVYATIAAQIPELYARNPTIAVMPTDAVSQAEMGKVKKFCASAEKVVRKMLVEEGKLKKRAKANIRSTSVTSFGALKVLYQKEYRGDAIAVRRIEDTQDNLARVEALIQDLKKADDPDELAKKRDLLSANLKALQAGNEVRIFKGFTIDRMKSEDFLVLDDNVAEFEEYVDAAALGHKIWMTVSDAKALFEMNPKGATCYGRPRTDANAKTDDTPAEDQFICVVEIWDKKNGVVRTTAKGMNRWLREPYAPKHVPQRWYPFYLLGFNQTEGEWRPLSDVELLKGLQDEYDRTRQNYADVREKSVPVLVFRKGGSLTEPDIKNLSDRKNKDTIGVEGNPAVPLSQDIVWFDGAKIDPAAYDVSMIRNDMDLVSGRSDASRANLIKPKTATEAEIMQEAMQSRVGERRDTNEDLMSEMGEAALEVALADLTKAEVQQIAGADAEWPENPLSVEIIFRMVTVQVRAGSSGRPNQQKEREQWGQLLPVISDAMKQVAELRMSGNYDAAEAVLELLRETLRRYDEHLDLDAIIPPTEKDENGQPVAQHQAAMELVQVKEALQLCQEELKKCQDQLQAAKSGEAAKVREAELKAEQEARDVVRKAGEENTQLQRDHDRAEADAQRASEEKLAKEAAQAEENRIADERARRELDAKLELDKHLALVKAATTLVAEQIKAAAAARAKDEEAQNAAEQEAFSAERFTTLIGDLRKTMEGLAGAFDGLSKDSAERTKLVKEHLTSG